jgi:hypothetical protein
MLEFPPRMNYHSEGVGTVKPTVTYHWFTDNVKNVRLRVSTAVNIRIVVFWIKALVSYPFTASCPESVTLLRAYCSHFIQHEAP